MESARAKRSYNISGMQYSISHPRNSRNTLKVTRDLAATTSSSYAYLHKKPKVTSQHNLAKGRQLLNKQTILSPNKTSPSGLPPNPSQIVLSSDIAVIRLGSQAESTSQREIPSERRSRDCQIHLSIWGRIIGILTYIFRITGRK